MSLKILIADKFPDEKIDEVTGLGCDILYDQSLKEDTLLAALHEQEPDILIVRSTRVNGDMIRADRRLNLIIRAGSGVNTIDVETASARSIYVANCPGKNAIAVAELTFGLILALDRRIPDNVIQLREGRWNKKEFSKAQGIYGRTLGVIGVGRIGREVISRALAFGMHVIAWSRSLDRNKAHLLGIDYRNSPEALAEDADIVTVHLALAPETEGCIGENFFHAMKPGACFINTSRAEVVDEKALLMAIHDKGIRAGLDVFKNEPAVKEGVFESDLGISENIYGTHHIGASTEQAQSAVADETIHILREFLRTGKVVNCVNLIERTPARWMLSIHHRNRVGVLAGVLDIIRDAGINIEIMENIIFKGADGACARIQLDGKISAESLKKIESSNKDILYVSQVELGK